MSRKHFAELAEALASTKPGSKYSLVPETPETIKTWKETVESVARVCRGFNDRFDKDRFLRACDYRTEEC